jgi:hypothetical protein
VAFSFAAGDWQIHIRSLKYKGQGYKYADFDFSKKQYWYPLISAPFFRYAATGVLTPA